MKTVITPAVVLTLLANTVLSATAHAVVVTEQDALHQTIAINNLTAPEAGCGMTPFTGKVAKRSFADDSLTVSGFVVEQADGTRMFVNVNVPDSLDRFTRGAVLTGLQRLLKEGRRVAGHAQACGSGPVLTLDQIR